MKSAESLPRVIEQLFSHLIQLPSVSHQLKASVLVQLVVARNQKKLCSHRLHTPADVAIVLDTLQI